MFLKVWKRPATFDARRGELGGYLRLMARSRALDLWREGQAAGRASDKVKVVVAGQESRPEDRPALMAERADVGRTVRAALRGLPENQREAVVLAHYGGLTADEIARPVERAARHRQEPHPARADQAARGVRRRAHRLPRAGRSGLKSALCRESLV